MSSTHGEFPTISLTKVSEANLSIDGRYFYAPSTTTEVRLTDIVNVDEIILRESIDEVEQQVEPGPIEMEASFFRLGFGLKFLF